MRSREDYSRSREKDYHARVQRNLLDDKGQFYNGDKNDSNIPNIVEIYNIPEHHNKDDIAYFIFKTLDNIKGLAKKSLNPIIKSEFISQKNCILLEFRTREEALNCLELNGVYYGNRAFYIKSKLIPRHHNKLDLKNLKIRIVNTKVQDSFNKIFIGNLPEMQQFELIDKLSTIGDLKSLQNITTNNAQIQYYCEFKDKDKTDEFLIKLNELKIKNRAIIAKRAALMTESSRSKVRARRSVFQTDLNTFYLTLDIDGYFKQMKISCVLLIKNIISNFMVKDEILKDIKKEVSKIGPVVKVIDYQRNVYIQFQRVEYAQIAYLILSHRKFEGKILQISFYDPLHFADQILL